METRQLVVKTSAIERQPFSANFINYLSVLLQVNLQRFHVTLEAQGVHREQDVFSVDRLPLLHVAPLARLARYETDELGHALLDALPGVLRDLQLRTSKSFML